MQLAEPGATRIGALQQVIGVAEVDEFLALGVDRQERDVPFVVGRRILDFTGAVVSDEFDRHAELLGERAAQDDGNAAVIAGVVLDGELCGRRGRNRDGTAAGLGRILAPMFVTFFQELKSAGVPVTLREYLTLMQAMQADLASRKVEDFYYLSRTTLVKDERNLDKFDRVFGHVFRGLEYVTDGIEAQIPAEWLRKLAEKYLTDEEKKQIEAMGGLDKLLETLKKRLAEQKGRHQGGSKWIGTGGTSPFGKPVTTPKASASAARARTSAR